MNFYLIHFSDKSVDLVLSVSMVTAFNKVVGDLLESSLWCRQLEWPQEVGGLFEVWSNGEDLVDQVLHTDDTLFACGREENR